MNRLGAISLILAGLAWAAPGFAQGAASHQSAPSQWVSYNSATKTVTFTLEAGAPGSTGPFPPQSTVVMNFTNHDGTPHSAEVIGDQDPMPNAGGDPAIPGAYTKDLTQGLPQGGTDVMRFTAPGSGSYRIFCGVPGHGLSGMWIRLKVDPAAKSPSLVTG